MARAIANVLSNTDVQVVWKFRKSGEYSDEALSVLEPFVASDRLRMPPWLTADPLSLLETGDVVLSVHHGGAGCYHETIWSGVPQVVLPLWVDLYGFAALAQDTGVGVWGCRQTSPSWTAECLGEAFLEGIQGDTAAVMRKKAGELGEKVRARGPGREIAAREVAKLAYVR